MAGDSIQVTVGENRYVVRLIANLTGRGINVMLSGGESPHIGAVAMCIPNEKEEGGAQGIDTKLLPVPGHKDWLIAKSLAELIAKASGEVTVVSAGVHIDKAEPWEIDLLCRNCDSAGQRFLELFKQQKR